MSDSAARRTSAAPPAERSASGMDPAPHLRHVVYPGRMTRSRRTVLIEDDLHARAHAVLRRMPGHPSLSSLINELLDGMVPVLEELVQTYETDGVEAAEDVMMKSVGRALLGGVTSHQRKEDETT